MLLSEATSDNKQKQNVRNYRKEDWNDKHL